MLFYALVALALVASSGSWDRRTCPRAFALIAIAGGSSGFANTLAVRYQHQVRHPHAASSGCYPAWRRLLDDPDGTSGCSPPASDHLGHASRMHCRGCCYARGKAVCPHTTTPLDAGDASYSICLKHPFVIPMIYIIASRTVPGALCLPGIIALSLAANAAVGRLGFVRVERPLLSWLRQSSAVPTVAIAR